MGRRLIAALALVCFGGCSSTATIVRADGPDNEIEITSSDSDALYVRARNGQIYRINRESVTDIDHPGNVEIIVGSLLLGFAGTIVFAMSQDKADNASMAAVSLVYGGPGLGLLLSGLYHYIPSFRAARAFETAETTVRPTPSGILVPAPAWSPPPLVTPPAAKPLPNPPAAATPPPPEEPAVVPDATSQP